MKNPNEKSPVIAPIDTDTMELPERKTMFRVGVSILNLSLKK
jgi:hypothetical protein